MTIEALFVDVNRPAWELQTLLFRAKIYARMAMHRRGLDWRTMKPLAGR